ncbi:hypothetical protein SAMN06265360_10230 [Haloechinothrix alba]|uniref:Alpha/beta hydrolase family protein n=1 Tax=Haloechinothrix alba TaxID=664784 RepID=A0A238VC56_9PSEU|nr:hypothetical protein [Haloechinothrix alba]SNR31811.1 hypothetical protein SAMN06265360_10230 [Haloechinothrix alba]
MGKNAIIFHGTYCTPDQYWYPWLGEQLESRGYTVDLPHYPELIIINSVNDTWGCDADQGGRSSTSRGTLVLADERHRPAHTIRDRHQPHGRVSHCRQFSMRFRDSVGASHEGA